MKSDPRPEAHYTMGIIYWHQGDFDGRRMRCARRSRLTPSTLTTPITQNVRFQPGTPPRWRSRFSKAQGSGLRAQGASKKSFE